MSLPASAATPRNHGGEESQLQPLAENEVSRAGQDEDHSEDGPAEPPKEKEVFRMKKEIGLRGGVAVIVGSIIGSGIFISPKGVAQRAGSVGVSILVWALCGLFSLLGATCYAELGTAIHRSGADFAYIMEAFGPLPAFLQLWVSLLIINPSAQAAVALTFARYILEPMYLNCDPPDPAVRLLAALCLAFLTYINCSSVKWSIHVQGIFTGAKLLALAFIVITGIVRVFQGETKHFEAPFEGHTSAEDLCFAFNAGLFAYAGWSYLNFATEEIKEPSKNLPLSIWIGIPLVTLVYVATNLAYFSVVSVPEMIASPAVAVTFAARTVGPLGTWIMPIFVACSTFGGVNGILFVASRLLCVGAQEGQLPIFLGMIHIKRRTPVPALLLACALSLVMLCTSDIYQLINYLSFAQWLFVGVSILGLLRLRQTRPDMPRPIKVHLIFPYLFLGCCVFLTVLPFYAQPLQTGLGILILLSGVPVYLLAVRKPTLNEGRFATLCTTRTNNKKSNGEDNGGKLITTNLIKRVDITKLLQKWLLVVLPDFEKIN